VTLFNSAGQDSSGDSYVDVVIPTGGLAPGQSITNTLLKFSNLSRVSFTFATAVLSEGSSVSGGTTIQDATGGTISVADPDNPSSIVSIVIPPGVLGVASDVISVSFSSTSPGPLNANAVAAGVHFASRVISLTRASGLKFLQSIQVTIPYDLTEVGPNDSMIVVYWDTTQNAYDVVETVGIDRINGTITFQTVHFSQYQAVAGVYSLAPGNLPPIDGNDTGFRAAEDGFPILNFTSMTGDARMGACFGLTSFAKWYYQTQYPAEPRLASNPIFKNGTAAQDDVAREVIYWGFSQTLKANQDTTWLDIGSRSDFETANDLFLSILVTDRPQLVTLAVDGTYLQPTHLHSVLVYGYLIDQVSDLVHFSFYDPNVPLQEQSMDYVLSAQIFSFPPYTDVYGTSYSFVYFDALSTFMAPTDFAGAYNAAQFGWPNRHFDEVSIDPASTGLTLLSPEGADPVTNPAQYQVFPGNTTFQMEWTCSCPPSGHNPVYAHIFFNGIWKQDIPIEVSAISDLLGAPTQFSFLLPPDTTAGEMIVIVSEYPSNAFSLVPNVDPIDEFLSQGYEGFLRLKLKPPLYEITELTQIFGTSAGSNEVPSEYTADNDQVNCYLPYTLPFYFPSYGAIESSLVPFSANFPLVCVGYAHFASTIYGVPPVIAPIFSDSLSSSAGPASAAASFSLQLSPSDISFSQSVSMSPDPSIPPQYGAGAGGGQLFQLSVFSPVHYQITASPTISANCPVDFNGVGTLNGANLPLEGTFQPSDVIVISPIFGGNPPGGCSRGAPSGFSVTASISLTPLTP